MKNTNPPAPIPPKDSKESPQQNTPDERELPPGWCWARVENLGTIHGGLTKNSSQRGFSKIEVPLVSVAAVRERRIDLDQVGKILLTESDGEKGVLKANDVLIVEGNGSIDQIGRVALWDEQIPGARHQNHIICVRPYGVLPQFLLEWLISSEGRDQIVSAATSASGLYSLSLSKVANLGCVVPPLPEQRRIVAKLDELLARSRKAREALEAIPPLLEKLRQSILAAAFRGDLTAAWREKNPDVEPASVLLQRIRTERRKKWEEAELAKLMAKGKTPLGDSWKDKYQEPEPVNTEGLPELPEGWCWVNLEQVALRITDGTHQSPKFVSQGIPFIVIANIIEGSINWNGVAKWIEEKDFLELTKKVRPEVGDVLYSAVGSYGTAVEIKDSRPFTFQRHIAHIKPDQTKIYPAFLAYTLNSPLGRQQADKVARGVAQKTVTLGDLKDFSIPLPPLVEQHRIVAQLDELLARSQKVWGALEASREAGKVAGALSLLDSLEQALLAKAFRGELVPQDPADEPAEVMLERLRKEQEQAPVASKRGRKPKEGGTPAGKKAKGGQGTLF